MVTMVTLTAEPRTIALEAVPEATTWLAPFAVMVIVPAEAVGVIVTLAIPVSTDAT
jgi:hypothetical protein